MISSRSQLILSIISLIIAITNIRPTHQDGDFLLIPQADGRSYSFENNICSENTFNGTFGKNLNHLLSSHLSSINATTSPGFYDSSYGESPDKVYAIGFCRGDFKPPACTACLATSTALIVKHACPNTKDGGVGSISCTLRYSNMSISGIRVGAPSISGYNNTDHVSSSLKFDYNQRLTTLFETLRSKAVAGKVLKFATGHSNAPVNPGLTIYGFVQCSPDLSETDCNVCLRAGLEQLPPCCYSSWAYLGLSCSLRYAPYLFYDTATDPTPLPPPSPPATSNSGGIIGSTSRMVITTTTLLVPVLVSMLLVSI